MSTFSARLEQFARHYLVALQYFTRVPVTGPLAEWTAFEPAMLRAAATHFPGVGLLVGSAACLVFASVAILLPDRGVLSALVAAIVCTVATVLLTGAFHEDGLADLADGLGGSADRERALEIMKDSRVGSFGALALVLAVAAKVALLGLLASVSAAGVLAALLAAHAVSRFWPLVVVHLLPYVGDPLHGKGKPVAEAIDRPSLLQAAAWCALPLLLMGVAGGPWFLLFALLASGAAWYALHALLRRRLQGFTGDGLGATQQVCEIAFYFGAAVGVGR
jgi:adenosylcobinamide-GDP ribazoletransferase